MIIDVQWIEGILVLIALVSAASTVARYSYVKAQLDNLRGDRDDLIKRVEILESDRTSLQQKNELLEHTILEERRKVAVLENVVVGRDILQKLQTTLDVNTQKVAGQHDAMLAKLDEISTKIRPA
jgi:hypothetical protein